MKFQRGKGGRGEEGGMRKRGKEECEREEMITKRGGRSKKEEKQSKPQRTSVEDRQKMSMMHGG